MTAAIVILALAAVSASGVAVAMSIRVGGLRADLGRLAGNLAMTEDNRDRIADKLLEVEAERARQRDRYEVMLADLNDEIATLEAECADPSVLRDRLGKMINIIQRGTA